MSQRENSIEGSRAHAAELLVKARQEFLSQCVVGMEKLLEFRHDALQRNRKDGLQFSWEEDGKIFEAWIFAVVRQHDPYEDREITEEAENRMVCEIFEVQDVGDDARSIMHFLTKQPLFSLDATLRQDGQAETTPSGESSVPKLPFAAGTILRLVKTVNEEIKAENALRSTQERRRGKRSLRKGESPVQREANLLSGVHPIPNLSERFVDANEIDARGKPIRTFTLTKGMNEDMSHHESAMLFSDVGTVVPVRLSGKQRT